jgi:hypothetical protein
LATIRSPYEVISDRLLSMTDDEFVIVVDEVAMTPNSFTIIQTTTPGVKKNPAPPRPS